jgi:hypothetical protein
MNRTPTMPTLLSTTHQMTKSTGELFSSVKFR